MELRDKNGLTETEFLQSYRQKDYPRPSLTADLVVIRDGELPALLLIQAWGTPLSGLLGTSGRVCSAGGGCPIRRSTGIAGGNRFTGASAGASGVLQRAGTGSTGMGGLGGLSLGIQTVFPGASR